MKKLSLLLLNLVIALSAFSQTEYVTPPLIRQTIFSVEVKDMIADKEEFKFAFTIENKSNDKYLVFELSKIAIQFSESDVYYPKNEEIIVVNPNSKERRTVRVVGKGNYQTDMINIEFPRMQVNGKQKEFTNSTNFATMPDQSINIDSYATASLEGFAWKKDSWSGELLVKTGTFDGMILMDLSKISGLTADNGTLPIEFKRDKLAKVALVSNDKFKSKFSMADVGNKCTAFQMGASFSAFELLELDVPQIKVKRVGYLEPVKVEAKEVNLCESFSKIDGLPVKVVLFNATGVCFKAAANGKKLNDQMCSNVEYDTEYGTNILTISMSNGQTITDKIYPAEQDSYLVFELVERKGEWKLRRKFDLSGDARKTESKAATTATALCKDQLHLNQDGIALLRNITVTKISKAMIYYVDCSSGENKTISKMEILAIEYPNGYYDKFDFPSNTGKQNMNLERTESEVIELRNSNKTSSSFIIGPNR
jgi:hypothetical protein